VPWCLIKLYYAAFYSGHALIRLFGESCTYLDGSHVGKINALGSALAKDPFLKLEKGAYHFVANARFSGVTGTKAGGSAEGSHGAFLSIFLACVRALSQKQYWVDSHGKMRKPCSTSLIR
jgi:hypothetical protein